MSARTPGGGGRRRNRRFVPRAASRGATASPPRPARTPRLTLIVVLLGGVLVGSFAHALLPIGARRLFEFAVVAGFALAAAMAYRRWVRGLIEERRRRERSS